MHLLHVTRGFAAQFRQQGLRATLNAMTDRLYIRWFEWWFGIRSDSVIELKELGIENEQCRPYVPTDYRSFLKVLHSLNVRTGEDVFLDFGSGLGRAVILAATLPFRKVIGVEFAPQLNEVARQNVRNALPRLKCHEVEIATTDATQFVIPPGVTVIYFFNPFCGEVLARVLTNIRASLRQNPRELRLICKIPAQSAFEEEIRKHTWLVKERELVFDMNCRYLFLTARVE